MTRQNRFKALACAVVAVALAMTPVAARAQALSLSSATVSLAGTSNIHEFTASTTDVRMTKLVIAPGINGAVGDSCETLIGLSGWLLLSLGFALVATRRLKPV